jgi:hypothetical protein
MMSGALYPWAKLARTVIRACNLSLSKPEGALLSAFKYHSTCAEIARSVSVIPFILNIRSAVFTFFFSNSTAHVKKRSCAPLPVFLSSSCQDMDIIEEYVPNLSVMMSTSAFMPVLFGCVLTESLIPRSGPL